MTDQVSCPRCGQWIVPIEKKVVVRRHNAPAQNVSSRMAGVMIGILMAMGGLIIVILRGFSSIGLAGLVGIFSGLLVLAIPTFHFLQEMRNRQYRWACPHCGHYPISRVSKTNGMESLEIYFTDVEEVRAEFEELVMASTLTRHLLIIHGIGGVGKSSLLWMFRLYCKKLAVPIAFCSGDEAKSLVDVLSDLAKDLTSQGIALPMFEQKLKEYHSIRQTVEDRAKAEQSSQRNISRTALRTAIQVAGGVAAGTIPLVGLPLSFVVGGASDALVDWLHSFLTKPQIDLLLDPSQELTDDFINDLAHVFSMQRPKPIQRIVLLLDTFEQMATLDKWTCNFARQLPSNVLLVLAGQIVPNWHRQWPGWTAQARIEELKPMSQEIMRQLVHRYYAAHQRGEPDPVQVEAVIHFARGLPMAVTSIVQLWMQYGVEDFQAVRPQVLADLVELLTKGIPERVRPVLKAAATLRWFNEELLQVILGEATLSDDVYEELLRFPIVRSRKEGPALHDSVREYLDDNLRIHEPMRHRQMHQRAATYFENHLGMARGEDTTELALELLYHQMLVDEEEGIKQFRKSAEELVRYQLLNQLRTLLNDVDNYRLQNENHQLWREYYRARLRELEGGATEAVQIYQMIAENKQAEEILRAYVLCDWAWIARLTSIEDMEQVLERLRILYPEPEALPEPEAKLGSYLLELGDLYKRQGRWNDAFAQVERARKFYERINDLHGLVTTFYRLQYYYLDRGMWKEGFRLQRQGLQEVAKLRGEQQQSYLKAEFLGGSSISWMWAGRYHETEGRLREALAIAERFERIQQRMYLMRDLALVLGLQGKLQESMQLFTEGTRLEREQQEGSVHEVFINGFQGLITLKWVGADQAEQYFTLSLNKLKEVKRKDWYLSTSLNWHGMLHEIRGAFELAEEFYRECLNLRQFEQWYWQAAALTGLARLYYIKRDYVALEPIMDKVEALAEQHEYNDYLALLRLMQGHMAWDSSSSAWRQGFDTALDYYKQALIYALRYNRFLLDEMLSRRPQGVGIPLLPIIPHCLKLGPVGQRMLQVLLEWWQSATNDIGSPRQDSISPIPEGIALLDGERMARKREPGDGHPQQTVGEQFASALEAFHS